MQRGCNGHTEAIQPPGGQPGVDQKHQVQAQQRQGEVDEDLRGVVPTKLSEKETEIKRGGGKQKVRHREYLIQVLDSNCKHTQQ